MKTSSTMLAMLCCALTALGHDSEATSTRDEAIDTLTSEAARLAPLVDTVAARELIAAVPELPPVEPSTLYFKRAEDGGYVTVSSGSFASMAPPEQEGFRPLEVDSDRYYGTFYGSPLASIRAFDLAARAAGWESFESRRVVDFGFGSVGQLHLLATCGARAGGTEVLSVLEAMYRDVPSAVGTRGGTIELAFGQWPADEEVVNAMGTEIDLFISKNTLKRGYVAPPEPVPAHRRIDLGVTPDAFLTTVHDTLAPGGLFLIYNIGGVSQDPDAAYISSQDIACPWTIEQCRDAGFTIIAHDQDDLPMMRRYARVFGWDEGPGAMDLDAGLAVTVTILQRDRNPS